MKKSSKQQLISQLKVKHIFIFGWGVMVACLLIWYALAQTLTTIYPQRLVTIYDRGIKRSVLTEAGTVRSALRFADISVDSTDVVDPSLDAPLTTTDADVIIYRSRLVMVADASIRQTAMTARQSPNEIVKAVGLPALNGKDTTSFGRADSVLAAAPTVLTVSRVIPEKKQPEQVVFQPKPNALTKSKGAQVYVDGNGVAHRETYYDLPMAVTMHTCGAGNTYTVRSDGAKVDQDGYVLVAANLAAYPRCTVVDTSMGPGKVYDTGGFAARYPYGFDLATDWTNYDGR